MITVEYIQSENASNSKKKATLRGTTRKEGATNSGFKIEKKKREEKKSAHKGKRYIAFAWVNHDKDSVKLFVA